MLKDKLGELAKKARDVVGSVAVAVGDLNGDGKVDEEDLRIAAAMAMRTAKGVGEEAAALGKRAVSSEMAKDVATGAAVGAVVAVPIPLIGSAAGAVAGAAFGVYKNLTSSPSPSRVTANTSIDIHAEFLKLDDLRQKGILTTEEFDAQKKKLLEP